ncbi:MAG TPA: hotdog domain-containing protein [Planctomycetota bacterium]|nr:hotdog domain-containing protein [Planctomycetota bacterium]
MRDPAIRVILLPRDTNAQGSIFGGVILAHIDLAGVTEARKHAAKRFVTVAIKEVEFKKPVYVGDTVSFFTTTKKLGTTSVTIQVVVEAQRWQNPAEIVVVTEAEVTFVAIDDKGQPTPIKG